MKNPLRKKKKQKSAQKAPLPIAKAAHTGPVAGKSADGKFEVYSFDIEPSTVALNDYVAAIGKIYGVGLTGYYIYEANTDRGFVPRRVTPSNQETFSSGMSVRSLGITKPGVYAIRLLLEEGIRSGGQTFHVDRVITVTENENGK
jgi:hypothetical protein